MRVVDNNSEGPPPPTQDEIPKEGKGPVLPMNSGVGITAHGASIHLCSEQESFTERLARTLPGAQELLTRSPSREICVSGEPSERCWLWGQGPAHLRAELSHPSWGTRRTET